MQKQLKPDFTKHEDGTTLVLTMKSLKQQRTEKEILLFPMQAVGGLKKLQKQAEQIMSLIELTLER
nr:MAG TPA: hypothetical protein [Caudoviricetes sp.]